MRRLLCEPGWRRCCGVGFVSFHSKVDPLQIFEQAARPHHAHAHSPCPRLPCPRIHGHAHLHVPCPRLLRPAALQVALGKPLLLQASAESPSHAPLRLRVSRPPEPSDVLWENLPCSRLECGLRQALGRL